MIKQGFNLLRIILFDQSSKNNFNNIQLCGKIKIFNFVRKCLKLFDQKVRRLKPHCSPIVCLSVPLSLILESSLHRLNKMLRFSKDDELSWCVVKWSSLFFHDEHLPFLGDDDGNWRVKFSQSEAASMLWFFGGKTWTNQRRGRNLLQDDVKSSDTIFHVEGCLREKLCGYY